MCCPRECLHALPPHSLAHSHHMPRSQAESLPNPPPSPVASITRAEEGMQPGTSPKARVQAVGQQVGGPSGFSASLWALHPLCSACPGGPPSFQAVRSHTWPSHSSELSFTTSAFLLKPSHESSSPQNKHFPKILDLHGPALDTVSAVSRGPCVPHHTHMLQGCVTEGAPK